MANNKPRDVFVEFPAFPAAEDSRLLQQWRKSLHESGALERRLAESVSAGDLHWIRYWLRVIADAIHHNIELSPGVAAFVADGLTDVANGKDAKAAFHLNRKRGQRDTGDAQDRALVRACAVAELRRPVAGKKRMPFDEAFAVVAEQYGASDETVRAAWRHYGLFIELSQSPGTQFFFIPDKKKRASRSK